MREAAELKVREAAELKEREAASRFNLFYSILHSYGLLPSNVCLVIFSKIGTMFAI